MSSLCKFFSATLVVLFNMFATSVVNAGDAGDFIVSFEEFEVPLLSSKPSGEQLTIQYARIQRRGAKGGIPTFYFSGGPGQSAIRIVKNYQSRGRLNKIFRMLSHHGPIYFMDQRGTGGSQPDQRVCKPEDELPAIVNGSEKEYQARAKALAEKCRRMIHDYATYVQSVDTILSAADFEHLRTHIGAPKIRVFGISYGSHIALSYIRSFGQHVDRAILALVEGPDHSFKLPLQFDAAVKKIDLMRVKNSQPPIYDLLKSTLKKFKKNQLVIVRSDAGSTSKLSISQFELKMFVKGFFGSNRKIDNLHRQLAKSDYNRLYKYVHRRRQLRKLRLKYYVTDCASYSSESRMALITSQQKTSLLGNALNFPFPSICSELNVTPLDNQFRSPVKSGVPTLLFSGDQDYKTPTANAVDVSKGFTNFLHVVEREGFHRICTKKECLNILNKFLQSKSITSSSQLIMVD
ncbi:MAG: alpha/beta hydrolase [Rhizobiaceae bacterium]